MARQHEPAAPCATARQRCPAALCGVARQRRSRVAPQVTSPEELCRAMRDGAGIRSSRAARFLPWGPPNHTGFCKT
jgi:hypothetical protein